MRTHFIVVFLTLFVFTFVNSVLADPPIVIQPIDPVMVDEDCGRIDIVNLNDVFADPDGRRLVFSIQNAPRDLNMQIGWNGILFFEPSEDYNIPDGIEISIVAANEQGEASETRFTLVINPINDPPPLIADIEDVTVDEDCGRIEIADLTEIFTDIEDDQLDYQIVGAPAEANVQIENVNNLFLNPDQDYNLEGGVEITIVASDDEGLTAEESFILIINPVNDPPILVQPIDDIIVDEDAGLVWIADLDDVFVDVEDAQLDFRFENDIEELNMGIDEENILFFDPDENFNLEDGVDITVTAEDDEGETVSDVFWLAIWGGGPDFELIGEIEDITIDEDAGRVDIVDLTTIFEDPEGDVLDYEIVGAPAEAGVQIENVDLLFLEADQDFNLPGGAEITVIASDDEGLTCDESFILTITPVNDAPMVREPIDDIVVDQNPGLTVITDLDEVFFDVDLREGDQLTFELENEPAELNMRIDGDNILSFNPDRNFAIPDGVEITVTATDQGEENVSEEFMLVIIPQPPDIEVVPEELQFDDVIVGEISVMALQISNTGGEVLVIEDIRTSNEVFSIEEDVLEIEPGEIVEIEVSFQPAAVEEYVETLTIFSNDENEPEFEVLLFGMGLEEPPPEPHFEYVETGIDNAILINSATMDGELLNGLDEIGVFTPGGVCAGGIQLIDVDNEFPLGVLGWGDDPQTEEVEGFIEGEELNFRFWDSDNEIEVLAQIDQVLVGGRVWFPNGFCLLTLVSEFDFDPTINVEPEEIDFGDVVLGEVGTQELRLTNVGLRDLIVEGIEINDGNFGTNFEDEIVLGRNEEEILEVWFDPEEEGEVEAILTFLSNNGGREGNEFEVELRGVGIEEQEPEPHFRFVQTGETHAIIITSATLNGEELEAQDEIAVFTPGGICAGAIFVDPGEDMGLAAWADDPQTEIVEGFQNGEQLNFRYWDFDNEIEVEAQIDEIRGGPQVWQRDGFTQLTLVAENNQELVEQVIELQQGWNMISLNIIPIEEFWEREDGPDVILMLEQIRREDDEHCVRVFKDEDGRFYAPAWRFNNIPFWNLQEGYQINVDEAVDLRWEGLPMPLDEDIQLERGWNLLGYAPDFELDASAPDFYVLSPIIENVISAKNGRGDFMLPQFNFSNMPPWRPGQGYQVNVDEDLEFTYPPEREEELAFAGNTPPSTPPASRSGNNKSTGSNMSVLLNDISGNYFSTGDRILVLSENDIIVGDGIIDIDNRCGLVVWGDDESTDDVDGLREGERFGFKLANDTQQLEIHVSEILMGSGLIYKTDDYTVVNVTIQPSLPDEYYLSTAYPNPFNSTTRILYGIPDDAQVSIKIYDITGSLVETLISENQSAGNFSVTWDAGSNSTGIYMVRIDTGQFNRVTKILLVK